jgi:dihydrofolate synthase / folylpolyglutamate synthase
VRAVIPKTIEECLCWLDSLEKFSIRPGLERMEYMMERLEHPHRRLKFIHVAGTNGKGSTCMFLHSILRKAGHDTGLFTSPYIGSFQSRIQYNEEVISQESLLLLVQRLYPIVEEMKGTEAGEPTEFEVITALAILYFATVTYPDIVIWETGLGGRWDSTNIVHPLASIITNVGFDHMNILGEDLPAIAREKAGIIKSGVPTITGEKKEEVLDVLLGTAKEKMAAPYRAGVEFRTHRYPASAGEAMAEVFDYESIFGSFKGCTLHMIGEHQVENAATAIMALQVVNQYYALYIEEKHIMEGLRDASLPGRFEQISEKPTVLLDGAHNVEGMEALVKTLGDFYPGKKVSLVFSVLSDKKYVEMISMLAPHCSRVWATRGSHPRAALSEELADVFQSAAPNLAVYARENWQEALQEAIHTVTDEDVLLVAGSLYFISDVKKEWKVNRKAGE